MSNYKFGASITTPDGHTVHVQIDAPERPDVLELSELAQMTAVRGVNLLRQNIAANKECPF
jgi:hypothetical protein